jgi:hypothetical protein
MKTLTWVPLLALAMGVVLGIGLDGATAAPITEGAVA